ncbi:MAG TPA: DUF1707 domain-containing protein [Streptosporangiaceae bacterium]|jgi:hypothetical protein
MTQEDSPGAMTARPGTEAAILASNAERDAAAQRLQVAFAEQRLTDEEFDQRIRAALTARTTADLDQLTADLPASVPGVSQAGLAEAGRKPGRFVVTFKNSIKRSGRWPVPKKLVFGVYKGTGLLDLRAADLTAPVTTIRALIYKSRTEIVLPPGVQLELGGLGVSADCDPAAQAIRPDAPVVRILGYGYKSTIGVTNRPQLEAGR